MSRDATTPEPPARKPALELPDVLAVESRRVPYERPAPRNFRSLLPAPAEVVEFLVTTAAPIPTRALSPVLYVGDTLVHEVVADDPLHYRFVGLEPDRLEPGAPLRIGWSGEPERRELGFRFTG